jgi:hypothetical protein
VDGEPAEWRSTIPGVHQREGAPASLGLVGWDRQRGRGVDGDEAGRPGGGPGVIRQGGHGRPWRAVGLAVVALLAILGVVRVVGTGAGNPEPGTAVEWELAGEVGTGGPGGDAGRAAGPASTPGDPHEVAAPSMLTSPEPASTAPPSEERFAALPPAPPSDEPSTAPASGDVLLAEPPDWWAVLAELDQRRAHALAARDLDLLADYAQPGSVAWKSDAAVVADLRERGLRPTGLSSRVLALERVERHGLSAALQVVDQRMAYSVVDAEGAIVEEVQPAGPTRWSVTLAQGVDDEPGWRVVDVIPAGSAGTGDGPATAAGGGGLEP